MYCCEPVDVCGKKLSFPLHGLAPCDRTTTLEIALAAASSVSDQCMLAMAPIFSNVVISDTANLLAIDSAQNALLESESYSPVPVVTPDDVMQVSTLLADTFQKPLISIASALACGTSDEV